MNWRKKLANLTAPIMKGVDIMLIFIIVYFIIGVALELTTEGKRIIENIKKYGILDTIVGTIIVSVMAPILFVYGMIQGATHQHTNKES